MSSKKLLLALLCGSLIFNGVVFSFKLFSPVSTSSSSNLPQNAVALAQHVARHILASLTGSFHGRSTSSASSSSSSSSPSPNLFASALAVIGHEADTLFATLLQRIFTLTVTVPGTDALAQSSSSLIFATTTASSSVLTDSDTNTNTDGDTSSLDTSSSSSQLADSDKGGDIFDTSNNGDQTLASASSSSDAEEPTPTPPPTSLPLSSSILPDMPSPIIEGGGTFIVDPNPETPIFVPSSPASPIVADTTSPDDSDDTTLAAASTTDDTGATDLASSTDTQDDTGTDDIASSSDASSSDTSSDATSTATSPNATTSSQLIANFEIDYSPSDFTLHFSWQPGADATATTTFTLTANASRAASSTQLLRSTSIFSYTLPLQQLGLRRRFTLRAESVGNVSQRIAQGITLPSFLDNVAFYPNPGVNQSGYVFDMTVSSTHPLWDLSDTSNDQRWSAIVIARNGANFPPSLDTPQNLQPQGITTLPLDYAGCNVGLTQADSNAFLLLPYNLASCRNAGLFSGAFNVGNLEDQRMILPVDGSAGTLSADDSFNLALYTSIPNGDGQRVFQLAEVDDTTYHPRESGPILSKPTAPPNVATQFNPSQSTVAVSWGSSTDDDTLDRTLTYEVGHAASDSSTADDLTWSSVGTANSTVIPVVFDKSYTIGVRARDQFDKVSESTLVRWGFPPDFSPLPFQSDHDAVIGLTGGGQQITPMVDVSLSAVDLWISADDGNDCCSESAVQVRLDDGNTPGRNQGTSETVSVRQVDAPGQARYVFDTPILLHAGSSYWLMPIAVGADGTRIYGSLGKDTYPDGFWDYDPSSDAYFVLEESP